MLNARKRPLLAAMLSLDAVTVPMSLWAGYYFARLFGITLLSGPLVAPRLFWLLATLTIPFLWVIFWRRGLYDSMRQRPYYEIVLSVVEAIGILLIISSALLFYLHRQKFPGSEVSGWVVAIFLIVQGSLAIVQRAGLKYMAGQIRVKSRRNLRRILIVGIGSKALAQQKLIMANPQWGYWIVGFLRIHEDEKASRVAEAMILGSVDQIDRIIDTEVVDEVMFAISIGELAYMAAAIHKCEEVGLTFHLAADFLDTSISRISMKTLDGQPVLSYASASTDLLRAAVKRAFDVSFSVTLMILGSPVFLVCALAVRLTSSGPIFFKQARVSLNGREFTLCKFRSMDVGAELRQDELKEQNEMSGPVFKIKDDPRITWVGRILRKTSLDEIPQFWNVLKGDMSVVGPRPLPTYEVANFERWQRRRLSMKPGLTCIWQIKGRNKIRDFDDWMKLDLEYIDNWTLTLDWKIILITPFVLLFGGGAR